MLGTRSLHSRCVPSGEWSVEIFVLFVCVSQSEHVSFDNDLSKFFLRISIIPVLLQSLVIPSKFHALAKIITLKSLLKSKLVMFRLGEWTWFQCISLPFPLYLYATVFLNLCRTSCKEASISHENMVDLRLIAHICRV